jgi:hypothetical protein
MPSVFPLVVTTIRYLMLDNTAITNAGLKHFLGMTKLKSLYLSPSRVTANSPEALLLRHTLSKTYIDLPKKKN